MQDFAPGARAGWTHTAHSEFVKVLYPYHPHYGQELAVVREDRGGLVFVKAPDGYVLGLPRWMTDASICRTVRSSSYPYCSAQALLRLADLIRTTPAGDSTG
jgi:hypothetical protein